MSVKAKQPPEIEENLLVSWFERKFNFLKPHYNLIALVTILLLLACILGAVLYNASRENYASQWNQLNLSITNFFNDQKTDHLTSMANELPGTEAGLWALQIAGDQELSLGLFKMTNPTNFPNEDSNNLRSTALRHIKTAKENFLQILESQTQRPEMLEMRTVFSLARASESLGEWDNAMKYYNQLVEVYPDCEFADYSRRGIARISNPDFVAFYDQFRSSDVGVAPGITLPEELEPNIDFELPDDPMQEQPETPNPENDADNQEDGTENPADKNEKDDSTEPDADGNQENDADNKSDSDGHEVGNG